MEGTAAMAIPATTTEPRLRHEEKHQVNLREALVLSRRLEKLFPRDPHAGPEGFYQVVSLYYDDPYDTALRQKLDGVDRREKFRLRYYGEKPAFFKLEKKYKVKGLCGNGAGAWQYTNEKHIPPIPGNVDCNIAYKNDPLIIKSLHLNHFKQPWMRQTSAPHES